VIVADPQAPAAAETVFDLPAVVVDARDQSPSSEDIDHVKGPVPPVTGHIHLDNTHPLGMDKYLPLSNTLRLG
jgi:hypothetical protein